MTTAPSTEQLGEAAPVRYQALLSPSATGVDAVLAVFTDNLHSGRLEPRNSERWDHACDICTPVTPWAAARPRMVIIATVARPNSDRITVCLKSDAFRAPRIVGPDGPWEVEKLCESRPLLNGETAGQTADRLQLGPQLPLRILRRTGRLATGQPFSSNNALGNSSGEAKEFGELIDDGEAALVIGGESKLQAELDEANLKAEKHAAKELGVSSKDIDKAAQEAAKDVS